MSTPRPSLLADWQQATVRSTTDDEVNLEQASKEEVERHRARVQQLRDPFTPLAQGDSAARAKETLLWENASVMVVVDRFWSSPKALVVPKTPVMFPCDAPGALLDELSRVAAATSDAFIAAGGGDPAKIWINPPAGISVRQLHVHVMPSCKSAHNSDVSKELQKLLQ